jgi:hypothetical protein
MTLGDVDLLTREQPTAVLAMCQSARAGSARPSGGHDSGDRRAPDAIRACYRDVTVARLAHGGAVPGDPDDRDRDSTWRPRRPCPCWVKRGTCTHDEGRVVFAATPTRRRGGARSVALRGIARAALQAHVDGVVVKFYGVADGRFFRCYRAPRSASLPTSGPRRAPRVGARPRVFGGDLVVTDEGKPVLVDLNDWPSFARCRDEAAEAIAGYVVDRLAVTWPRTQGQHG